MNNALESFVSEHCPPTRMTLWRDAIGLMEEFSIEEFEGDVLNDVFSLGARGAMPTVDAVHEKLQAYLEQVLQAHNVELLENATMQDYVTIADSLLAMQSYIDHDDILRITETDMPADEKFAELVQLVNGQLPDRTFSVLGYVDENLVARLHELHKKKIDDEQVVELASPDLVDQLRLLRQFVSMEDAVGWKLVRRNIPIGSQLGVYLQYTKKHVEHLEDERLAKELLILLYMAGDTYRNPLLGFREASQHIFDDMLRITKIDIRLAQLVSDFITYQRTHQNNSTTSMMQ